MSEKKHYGRQILLSLFIIVFILLGLLYLALTYVFPLYSINQEQIYKVLVKLFPLLIGLIMIEIGVLVARRRNEDFVDEIDKLPPNAYDKPLYTLPGDDPLHRHTDEMVLSQRVANKHKPNEPVMALENELFKASPSIRKPIQPTFSKVEDTESVESVSYEEQREEKPVVEEYAPTVLESRALEAEKPVVEEYVPTVLKSRALEAEKPVVKESIPIASSTKMLNKHPNVVGSYSTDFKSILSAELENAQEMDYDLTLVLVNVSKGPAEQITNKMIMLSGELAYSFTLENNKIAMVLPFYNAEESRSFTLTLLESCKKEFSGASLQIGFASRNGRELDSSLLLHEALTACMLENDEVDSE